MRFRLVCATVASLLFCAGAYADPAACRAEIIAANQKSMETPNHTFFSQIEAGASGLVTKSETINVGNKTYIKLIDVHVGKTRLGDDSWSIARNSPQDTAKTMLQAMRDAAKETKNYQCAHVRDETIDGVAAAVYSEHAETEDGKSDAQTWISKNQGLILKYQANIDDMAVSMRYVYTNIQAPANAKGPDR